MFCGTGSRGLVTGPPAWAGVEVTRLEGWTAQRWTKADGLPIEEVRAVDLDPDGLAWIATLDGLLRFDGHEFQVHTPSVDPGLPTSRFVDVAVEADGTVWAVTEGGGLVSGVSGRFESLRPAELGLGAAFDLVRTSAGTWVVGDDGLARVDGATATPVRLLGDAPFGSPLRLLQEDASGDHWLVEVTGAVHRLDLAAGRRTRVATLGPPEPLTIGALPTMTSTFQPVGAELWAAGKRDVVRLAADGTLTVFPTASGPTLLRDLDGDLIVDAGGALLRPQGAVLAPLEGAPAIPAETWWTRGDRLYRGADLVLQAASPLALLHVQDDGSAWVAERAFGLLHVRRGAVTAIQRDALGEIGVVNPVLVDRAGGLWIGAEAALRRHLGEEVQPVLDEAGRPVQDPRALLELRDGDILVTTATSACRVAEPPPTGPLRCRGAGLEAIGESVTVAVQASDGGIWLGSSALRRLAPDGRMETVVPAEGRHTFFRAVVEAADGVLWAAAQGRGLFRIEGGQAVLRGDDLSSPLRVVRALHLDDRGDAWLGTEGRGVCRLSNSGDFARAPLTCVSEAQGLADGFVSSLATDGRGRVWMSSNRGLQAARWDHLVEFVEGRRQDLHVLRVGRGEGMVEPETNGVTRPAVARGAGGVLWYPTMSGVARLDPAAAEVGRPPRAVLESLATPSRALDPGGAPIVLGPDERELRARWTAAEFTRVESLRFRYRLEGLDHDWRGPSADRLATWTALPPGSYRLQIQSGWAGRWHPEGVGVSIEVPPTFRETRLYPASLGLLAVAFVAVFAATRVRAVRGNAEELRRAVETATGELAARNRRLVEQAAELTGQRLALARQAADLEERNVRIASQADELMERNARVAAQAERLAQVDQARTRFVANISHELRTPLTLVRGALEDLTEVVPDRARQPLQTAGRNAERLAQLVEQLLDVAKVDAGGMQLRARRTEAGPFVARICERFEAAARARGVTLRQSLPPGIEVWLDPDLMEKVLTNLLSNGLDYCPEGGWLSVEARAVGDDDVGQLELRVTDSGPGVPDALRERIFDRFFQAEDGDRRRRGGAGIGLSLARELVALHGGAIDVENRPGASFRVLLPLGATHLSIDEIALEPTVPGPARVAPPVAPDPAEPEDSSLPVALVVEDHADMRAYVAAHLGESFRVVDAVDGQDAMERLMSGLRPKVVVSDVMMPRLDGLALCRALRSDARWASLPVLLLSAKATDEDRVAGLSLADAYLTKPFRAAEMVATARQLAEHGRGALAVARPEAELMEAEPWSEADVPIPRPALPPSPLLERLEQVAREHMADPSFGAAQLAKKAGVSPRQLLRRVQEETGMTVAAWLREVRLREAQARLRNGEVDTVAGAAAAVGLNPAYLSRVYLAWAGRRPSDELSR